MYSSHLINNGYIADGLARAREAPAIQCRAPALQNGFDCVTVLWKASGEEHIALTSARTILRSYETAVDDLVCLKMYAIGLAYVGRWSEALIIANEAMNCLDALTKCGQQVGHSELWFQSMEERHQNIISNLCSPPRALDVQHNDKHIDRRFNV